MSKYASPLNNIKIASPCSADWNQMIGGERQRFCGECQLNVYNLSGMTRSEAEKLLMNSEGRLCVRFYKRTDGTILTKDCPVGWRAFKKRVSRTAAAFASLVFGILSGLGFYAYSNQTEKRTQMGKISISDNDYRTMGAVSFEPTPRPVMGNVSMGVAVNKNVKSEVQTTEEVGKIVAGKRKK